MENKILTQSGTNELEIIEFYIGSGIYGINVAKVSQITKYIHNISDYPNSAPAVKGIINYRGDVIPVVNLFKILEIPEKEHKQMMIITNFNERTICFIVGAIRGIHKDEWNSLESSHKFMDSESNEQYIIGVLKKEEELISVLDLESILSRLLGQSVQYDLDVLEELIESDKEIVFAEDSSVTARVLKDNLLSIGFKNIKSFTNGEDIWNYLNSMRDEDNIENIYCILTDIEMPKMDGLTLCKKVKADSKLNQLKVILFSSLITDELRNKGYSVGADAQISKPNMKELLSTLKSIVD